MKVQAQGVTDSARSEGREGEAIPLLASGAPSVPWLDNDVLVLAGTQPWVSARSWVFLRKNSPSSSTTSS